MDSLLKRFKKDTSSSADSDFETSDAVESLNNPTSPDSTSPNITTPDSTMPDSTSSDSSPDSVSSNSTSPTSTIPDSTLPDPAPPNTPSDSTPELETPIKPVKYEKMIRYIVAIALVFASVPFSDQLVTFLNRFIQGKQSKYSNFISIGFLSVIIKMVTIICACFIALNIAGFSPLYLWSGIGILAFAIPIALQVPIQDFACGLLLVAFDKIRIGETVTIDKKEGIIQDIQAFTTNVLDPSTNGITEIPNSKLWGMSIQSASRSPKYKLTLTLLISHRNDIRMVEKIIKKIVSKHSLVKNIDSFGYSSQDARGLIVDVHINVKTKKYLKIKSDLYNKLKIGLQDHGVVFVDGASAVAVKYKSNVVTPIIIDNH